MVCAPTLLKLANHSISLIDMQAYLAIISFLLLEFARSYRYHPAITRRRTPGIALMPHVTSLIARFKAGSHSAYHHLFAAYFPGLVFTASRHLGPAPPGLDDAEDVALSAFVGL